MSNEGKAWRMRLESIGRQLKYVAGVPVHVEGKGNGRVRGLLLGPDNTIDVTCRLDNKDLVHVAVDALTPLRPLKALPKTE